jgi:hypothetical protein
LGILFGFARGILGGGDSELCFFLHKICGEFVVIRWFLCAFCWWETTGFLDSSGSDGRPGVGALADVAEAHAKPGGGFAVAEQAEGTEVVEVALAASFGYGADVVGVP